MAEKKYGTKRSMKNLLLDRRFQLKYSVAIALTGGVIFAVMGWLFYDKVRENSQLAAIDELAVAAPAPPAAAPKIEIERQPVVDPGAEAPVPDLPEPAAFEQQLLERLEQEDDPILWSLGGFWVALVVALFLVGILATHRIVGPIFVVDTYVRRIMNGEPVRPRALRRGDEFQGLFARVNEMARRLRDERAHDLSVMESARERLRARLDTMGEGTVDAATVARWLDEDLSGVRELAEEKRRYVEATDAN